ncbi:MAG TPA: hypothetical protein VHE83_06610 [Mycobacteriales bacterium]|nr:hypothetical protein [Mycobacteriales bacterium]
MPWPTPEASGGRRGRAIALAAALVVAGAGGGVLAGAPAQAADGSTAVSTATPTTFPVVAGRQDSDGTLTLLGHAPVHVTGTAAGRSSVDIACTTGTTAYILAPGTPVTNGAFAVDADPTAAAGVACTLRALPAGTPGGSSTTQWSASPYRGIALSAAFDLTRTYAHGPAAGRWYDYDEFDPLAGAAAYEVTSAGGTGIANAALATGADTTGTSMWSGAARYPLDVGDGAGGLQIDGAPALLAAQAARASTADAPGLAYTGERDGADGALSLHETEPVQSCAGGATPTADGCGAYASTGVAFDRRWHVEPGGRQLVVTDTFTGTDGASHALTLTVEDDVASAGAPAIDQGSGLHALAAGQTWSPAAGAGSFVLRRSGTAADGDPAHPAAAVTWSLAPSLVRVAGGDGVLRILSDTKRVLAAHASLTITRTYSLAPDLAGARALAAAAVAAQRPHVAIDALPAHVASWRLVVSGTVSPGGNGLPGSVTVHGVRAAVRADGRFRLTTRLRPGRSMLRWTAVDPGGLTGSGPGRLVTFASPISAGRAHRVGDRVALPLRCAAWVGRGHACRGVVVVAGARRTVQIAVRLAAGHTRTVTVLPARAGAVLVVVTYADPAGGTVRVTRQTVR